VLAAKTNGVVLVLRVEKTEKDAVALAIRQLRQVDAELLGAVVNLADAEGWFQTSYSEYLGGTAPSGIQALLSRLRDAFS
jgi:Mrp family chromosome partitioning ATPase